MSNVSGVAGTMRRFPEDGQFVVGEFRALARTSPRIAERIRESRTQGLDSRDFRKRRTRWHDSCCPCVAAMTNQPLRTVGLILTLLILSTAGYAADRDEVTGATGVTLYEISERVTFDQAQGVIVRNATSPLQGFAALGTPLCPSALLISAPRIKSCTVIATGTDSVSTVTGLGPVSGTFDVVINAPGNSSVHVPDLPVINGTFSGKVDLSLAVLHHIPLGSITGTFTIMRTADPATGTQGDLPQPVVLPFNGTFRMPFKLGGQGRFERSQRDHAAVYLADDLHTVIPVKAFERSTGFPDVRLEVNFGF